MPRDLRQQVRVLEAQYGLPFQEFAVASMRAYAAILPALYAQSIAEGVPIQVLLQEALDAYLAILLAGVQIDHPVVVHTNGHGQSGPSELARASL
jgi:hypothetical protein